METLLLDESNPEQFIFDAETKSQEQISMFLRKRYDLPKLFTVFPDHQSGSSYTTGQTVWYTSGDTYSYQLYVPTGTTGAIPTTAYWTVSNPRSPTIVDWMVTISLYRLHERLAPSNIPKHRKESYDEVMRILKMIQDGKLSTDFPEVENRIQTIVIDGDVTTGQGFHY